MHFGEEDDRWWWVGVGALITERLLAKCFYTRPQISYGNLCNLVGVENVVKLQNNNYLINWPVHERLLESLIPNIPLQ